MKFDRVSFQNIFKFFFIYPLNTDFYSYHDPKNVSIKKCKKNLSYTNKIFGCEIFGKKNLFFGSICWQYWLPFLRVPLKTRANAMNSCLDSGSSSSFCDGSSIVLTSATGSLNVTAAVATAAPDPLKANFRRRMASRRTEISSRVNAAFLLNTSDSTANIFEMNTIRGASSLPLHARK